MNNFFINSSKNRKSENNSILDKVERFQEELQLHEKHGLNSYKKHPYIVGASKKNTKFHNRFSNEEKSVIMFGSNSYLGVAEIEDVTEEAIRVLREFGIGSGSSYPLTGHTIYHESLEKKISELYDCEDAVIFSSGYGTNLGLISALARTNNLVIHDRLNHASLIDGTILSGASMKRFKHNDMNSLVEILEETRNEYKDRTIIVSEGVFSMDGDIANLPELIAISKQYNTLLILDEAHGLGVIGERGRGSFSYHNILEHDNVIISGTLSKSIGAVGGFVTGKKEIIDYIRIYARSTCYSTTLPPNICAAAVKVLEIMESTDVVEKLKNNYRYAISEFRKNGFNIMNTETAVIPVIIDCAVLSELSNDLEEYGIVANPVFPDAVPPNKTRLRISIMASHTKEDIDYLISVMIKLFDKYGLSRK